MGLAKTVFIEDSWLDEISGLHWLPEEPRTYNHHDAVKKFGDRLPTKEEFEEAEKHGIRKYLNMKDKWFWSSSIDPNDAEYAYVFNGDNGNIDSYYRYYDSGSVRCVGHAPLCGDFMEVLKSI